MKNSDQTIHVVRPLPAGSFMVLIVVYLSNCVFFSPLNHVIAGKPNNLKIVECLATDNLDTLNNDSDNYLRNCIQKAIDTNRRPGEELSDSLSRYGFVLDTTKSPAEYVLDYTERFGGESSNYTDTRYIIRVSLNPHITVAVTESAVTDTGKFLGTFYTK